MSSTTQVPLNQEQQPQRAGTSFVRSALEWAETIVMAVVLVAVVFTFLARIITVDGRSMEPTYHNGDRVLVTKLAGAPQQGDVVIVVNALEEPIIKRVIATEGQTVDFDPSKARWWWTGKCFPALPSALRTALHFCRTFPAKFWSFRKPCQRAVCLF